MDKVQEVQELINSLTKQIDDYTFGDKKEKEDLEFQKMMETINKINELLSNNSKENETIPQQYYKRYKHNYKKYYETHKEEIKEKNRRRYAIKIRDLQK